MSDETKAPFRISTTRDRIRAVPQRWKDEYLWKKSPYYDFNPQDIYDALLKLDLETCTAEEVEAIIDAPGWTAARCDACNEWRDRVVFLNFTEYSTCICYACWAVGWDMFNASPPTKCEGTCPSLDASTGRCTVCGTKWTNVPNPTAEDLLTAIEAAKPR